MKAFWPMNFLSPGCSLLTRRLETVMYLSTPEGGREMEGVKRDKAIEKKTNKTRKNKKKQQKKNPKEIKSRKKNQWQNPTSSTVATVKVGSWSFLDTEALLVENFFARFAARIISRRHLFAIKLATDPLLKLQHLFGRVDFPGDFGHRTVDKWAFDIGQGQGRSGKERRIN